MNEILLQDLVAALTRIAVAIESLSKIDGTPESPPPAIGTPFPWSEMTFRTADKASRLDGKNGFRYPFSCEELVSIGRQEFLEVRDAGSKSADEISHSLNALGFPQWNRVQDKPRTFSLPMVLYASVPINLNRNVPLDPKRCEAATRPIGNMQTWHQCKRPATNGKLCPAHHQMELQNGRQDL